MSASFVQVRIDDDLKNQAAAICGELGIDLSTAIRIFLKKTVLENGIPFSLTLPSRTASGNRAVEALRALSQDAEKNGTSDMTLEEINAEIDEVRRNRIRN